MKPNILICGRSGSGKSTSLRNLDPKKTIILNIERKQLPFKNARDFEMNVSVADLDKYHELFDQAIKSDKADTLVIESFTGLTEIIYREARNRYKGYDLWDFYNREIDRALHKSKDTNKNIIFTAIDDVLEGESGISERCVKVDGKVWRKKVEKEFLIVLYTEIDKTKDGMEYVFVTNTDGYNSAKSPMEMLEYREPNDISEIIKKSKEYYGETNGKTEKGKSSRSAKVTEQSS